MPIYEYECHRCGHRFSESMHVAEHEDRHVHCPRCDSEDTESLILAAYVATARKS